MKTFNGNYLGIVIQNNDPEKAGKIKVFVPHVTASVYKKWVEKKTNKSFKFIGANIDSILSQTLLEGDAQKIENLTPIIEDLKLVLPWAHCAAPLTSEDASGRYNNYNNFANISDSNFYSTFSQSTSSAPDTPGKPGYFFEKPENRLTDAFVNSSDNINNPNPLAYEYVPSTYSNRAKGSFGVPAVGSHVWVFFREGNPTLPVYFAVAYGVTDWKGIYEAYDNPGIDYPGTFENKNASYTENDVNVETYRNKYVINQKGGSIEITNTDLKENLKFTHYSGSFKEFNNQSNIELAANNDQKLTLNDSYDTVRGFRNVYTGKNLDEIITRDKYKKVGNLNAEYFEQWKEIYAPIQDNKQLFEIQRAENNNIKDSFGNIVVKRNSVQQQRVGTFAPHPALSQLNYSLNNDSSDIPDYILSTLSNVSNDLVDGGSRLNVPSLPAAPLSFPNLINYTTDSGIVWNGIPGLSTSSENGIWLPDPRKELIKQLTEAVLLQLVEIEKKMGVGGSEIVQITKHKIETIGMVVNDFGSIRFDNVGKMLTSELLIDELGTYFNYEPSPLIEYTHVQDLPGGDYTLSVGNRWNVTVGAGGINLKTLGTFNATGTVMNVAGEQLNLSSQNEININSKTINISAEILRLRNTRQKQILIENSLGVNNNVVVGGALSVEGEVFLQHVTAPTEYQVTNPTTVIGSILPGTTIPIKINIPLIDLGLSVSVSLGGKSGSFPVIGSINTIGTITVDAPVPNSVQVPEHTHIFKNIPLTLYDKNLEVRRDAQEINNNDSRVVASPRYHGPK
jgi:hypothetical protein